jgi:SsrA-binding protein
MPPINRPITKTKESASKIITVNRRARRDYEILETLEAGLVLTGTEIKSIRLGKVNIQQSFARASNASLWLYQAHIAEYNQGNIYNHEPTRPRKLLLRKKQIRQLMDSISQMGLTLVPLKMYIKGHYAKVELGLARGRRLYDKRQVIIDREKAREADRDVSRIAHGRSS